MVFFYEEKATGVTGPPAPQSHIVMPAHIMTDREIMQLCQDNKTVTRDALYKDGTLLINMFDPVYRRKQLSSTRKNMPYIGEETDSGITGCISAAAGHEDFEFVGIATLGASSYLPMMGSSPSRTTFPVTIKGLSCTVNTGNAKINPLDVVVIKPETDTPFPNGSKKRTRYDTSFGSKNAYLGCTLAVNHRTHGSDEWRENMFVKSVGRSFNHSHPNHQLDLVIHHAVDPYRLFNL